MGERVLYCEKGREEERWGYGLKQEGGCCKYEGSNIDWRVKDGVDDSCKG
jgi:hypothetical protein